jgi:putative nucleotidyltransferase with HDIG domain
MPPTPPGMTGAELLNEVFRLYPATFRVILTGFVEQSRVMETIGTAHQFLSKPFELDRLKELLQRAATLRARLRQQRVRTIVSQAGSVPSVPNIYFEILKALQAPDCPVERIAQIVATDPGLTSKILQLVNSAFFGLASEISSAHEAVMLLGTGIIRSLALTCGVFSAFPLDRAADFSVDQLRGHSIRVARIAERICRFEQTNSAVIEQAFTAGLLHDIGKLILAHSLASEYPGLLSRSLNEKLPLAEIETAALGTTHAEVGACLLQLWGLPSPLIEAVLWHEQPSDAPVSDGLSALTAVCGANLLDHEATEAPGSTKRLEATYLDRLGLQQRLELWRQHCLPSAE